jgi:hypothetical protein
VALTLVLATACSAGPGQSTSTQSNSSSAKVSPDDAATLHLTDGLAVSVPRGTVAGRGTLLGMTIAAPGAAPRGMTLAGPTYDLRIAQTRLTGRVRLTVPVPPPAASGPAAGPDDALLAFYDTTKGRWQPIAATYHRATRSLTATSPHLSLWSALRLDASTVLSQATSLLKGFIGVAGTTAQPACPGTSQLSAYSIKPTSDKGNLVKWCAGVNPSGAPLLRVADNRSYAMETTYPATWVAARTGPADPIARQVIDSVARFLSPADWRTSAAKSRSTGSGRTRRASSASSGSPVRRSTSTTSCLAHCIAPAQLSCAIDRELLRYVDADGRRRTCPSHCLAATGQLAAVPDDSHASWAALVSACGQCQWPVAVWPHASGWPGRQIRRVQPGRHPTRRTSQGRLGAPAGPLSLRQPVLADGTHRANVMIKVAGS